MRLFSVENSTIITFPEQEKITTSPEQEQLHQKSRNKGKKIKLTR